MAPLRYLDSVRKILLFLEESQLPGIERAAAIVSASLVRRGVVYCAEIGHGIQRDFIHRAGGLAAVQPFSWKFTVMDQVPSCLQGRPPSESVERDLEAVRLAVRVSNLRAGDVMVVASVSGGTRAPIELALACRTKGVRTIGLTSLEYARHIASQHPSGKKLHEVVDVAIDNGAPYGDAAVPIPGYDFEALPVSGVSMAVIGHMLWGAVMERMAAQGVAPAVLVSMNRREGKELCKKAKELYEKRGF